ALPRLIPGLVRDRDVALRNVIARLRFAQIIGKFAAGRSQRRLVIQVRRRKILLGPALGKSPLRGQREKSHQQNGGFDEISAHASPPQDLLFMIWRPFSVCVARLYVPQASQEKWYG